MKTKVQRAAKQPKTGKKELPVLIITGPQGCGKGTQAELLVKKYGFVHFEMGGILRKEVKKKTPIGSQVAQSMAKGELVPTKMVETIWHEQIKKLKNKPLIMDGFPRQMSQAKEVEKGLKNVGRKITVVIDISLSANETYKRLALRRQLEGRVDDTPESIKKRLAWSRTKLKSVLNYYAKKYPVKVVKGEQAIEKVQDDILKILKKYEVV